MSPQLLWERRPCLCAYSCLLLICAYCHSASILEYACPVWHSGLTTGQCDKLESLQKRALKIIFCDIDYHMSLIVAGLDTLYSCRQHILQRFINRTLYTVHLVLITYYQSNMIL